jgi:hypothetical protein
MKENVNGAMALLVGMFVQDLWNVHHVQHKQDLAANDHRVIEHQKYIHQELRLHMPLMMQTVLIGKLLMLTKLR